MVMLVLLWSFSPSLSWAFKSQKSNEHTLYQDIYVISTTDITNPTSSPQQLVTVEGYYVDKKANPMPEKTAEFERDDLIVGSDITDEEGYFCMEILPVGVNNPIWPVEEKEPLAQNYPNPFITQTTIEASIEEQGNLSVYDLQGRLVSSIDLDRAGNYEISWGGMNLAAGVYVYSLTTPNKIVSKKMINSGSGFSGFEIRNYEEKTEPEAQMNASMWKSSMLYEGDSIMFSGPNSTFIKYQFELLGDTLFTQIGNPGPDEFNPMLDVTAPQGDTIIRYILDHVYNDEATNDYSTQTIDTWVSNDTLYHIVQPTATLVELEVTDQTDPSLEIIVDFFATPEGGGNQPPVAVDDSYIMDEDTSSTFPVVDNDYDPDGNLDPSTVDTTGLLPPSHGVITFIDPVTGAIDYEPDTNYFGTDQFEYKIYDSLGLWDVAMVFVHIDNINDAPTANTDNVSTAYETAVVIPVPDNDTDIDGNVDPTTVDTTGVTPPSNGQILGIDPVTGYINYLPNNGFVGIDSLEYIIWDDGTPSLSDTAWAYIEVAGPGNQPPVSVDDAYTIDEDDPVTVFPVVDNDYDPDGNLDPSTVDTTGLLPPSHGVITYIDPVTGAISYDSDENYSGTDQFEYKIYDTDGLWDVALVSVQIDEQNDPPQANDDSYNIDEDVTSIFPVLDNDSDPLDPNGGLDPSSVSITTPPLHGTILSINPTTGAIEYDPDDDYDETDTFMYQVGDNGTPQMFDTATVTVNITAINDPPYVTTTFPNFYPYEDSVLVIPLRPDHFDDVDSPVLTYPVNNISNATSNVSNDTLYITPTPNWYGIISGVTVDAFDGEFTVTSNAFNINYQAVNDNPTANDDVAAVNQDQSVTIDVLVNDNDDLDPNGGLEPNSVNVTTPPSHGSTSVNPTTGEITYTSTPGWYGVDSFVYEVGDNGIPPPQLFDDATVTVTVNQVVGQVYFKIMDLMQDTLLQGATLHIGGNSYVLSAGDTSIAVTPGTYELNATHPNTIDWTSIWEEYTIIQRPRQNANVEQRARNDYTSQVTFTGNADTLNIYKVMNDFNLFTVIQIIGSGPQGQTHRFSDNDLDAPAWFNLNYTAPTATTETRVQHWIQELVPATKGKLNMVYQASTTTPSVPYLEMAIDPSFPASNATSVNNHEIVWCYAHWPNNSQSFYSLGIEMCQAVGDLNDIGSTDPPILSYNTQTSQWEINWLGQCVFHLLYNTDPGTRF